jgi:hypothetical protein
MGRQSGQTAPLVNLYDLTVDSRCQFQSLIVGANVRPYNDPGQLRAARYHNRVPALMTPSPQEFFMAGSSRTAFQKRVFLFDVFLSSEGFPREFSGRRPVNNTAAVNEAADVSSPRNLSLDFARPFIGRA